MNLKQFPCQEQMTVTKDSTASLFLVTILKQVVQTMRTNLERMAGEPGKPVWTARLRQLLDEPVCSLVIVTGYLDRGEEKS